MSHPVSVPMHSAPLPPWRDWQPVMNAAFPPKAWRIARAAEPIPERARIVWRTDGEQWLNAIAARWTTSSVQVEFQDPRLGLLATGSRRETSPGASPS